MNITNYKVLYAEDDVVSNEICTSLLLKKFGTVCSVQNGLKGLQEFKRLSPDLVITDLNMPIMCGCEMINNIREINKEVPIIITTAYPEHLFGDLIYFTKPIRAKSLFETIDNVLSGRIKSNLTHELEFYDKRHPNGSLSPCL